MTATRLQEKCPDCGKVAIELFSTSHINKEGNTVKWITLKCFHIVTRIIPKATPFDEMVSNWWKPEVKACKHHWLNKIESKTQDWPTNKCTKCGEFRLFPFQVLGARAAESGLSQQKGFGIFDDMGLGKTVQALAVILYHREYTPTLYIVKSRIKFQWMKQIVRWLGMDYLPMVITTSRDYLIPGLKSYIISYDLLTRFPKEKLEKLGIKLVVMDECQQIKNVDSNRTQVVRMLVGNADIKVLPLSGTPWKNRGSEFYPVLNMIDPIKFYSPQQFLEQWVDWYWDGAKRKMGGIRNPEKFREYVSELLIRREYNEVMDEHPEINKMKLDVKLDDLSQSAYDEEVSNFVKWYNDKVISGLEESINGMEILAKMTRMRHITGLAKIPATLGFVEEFIEDRDDKLVIFVHHKDVGMLLVSSLTNTDPKSNPDYYELAIELKKQNIQLLKLSAEFNDAEAFVIQEKFNNSKRAVMVASTLANGEGIDLQTCANWVMHERQWNPQNEDQAGPGRFRRIGQLAKVLNGTYVEAEGTIDEHIDGIVERKRIQFHNTMNKSELPKWNETDFAHELAQLIISKHKERNKGKNKPTVSTKAASLRPINTIPVGLEELMSGW